MKTFLAISLLFLFLVPSSRADAALVDEILRNLIERSEDPQSVDRRNRFSYQRVSRVEYLNEDGTKKRDTIRIFAITPENGEPVTRLISVNGRPTRDKEDKNKSAARETGDKSRTLTLNEDLLSRFKFTLVGEKIFASRPVWVLAFVPNPDAPTENFLDRLINSMSGTFLIDKEEFQLARADVRLNKRVSFFGGIAGAIDKLDLTLVQRRLENSVWLGEAIHIDFVGRKLLSDIRFRCFENCTNFEAVPAQHASAK